jgi:hypothetical protein
MSTPEVRAAIYEWIANINSPVDTDSMYVRFQALVDKGSVDKESLCELWGGSLNMADYPIFTIKGVAVYAHRIAVRLGDRDKDIAPRAIPYGMTVDHVKNSGCKYRYCVNREHLEVVTQSTNAKRIRDLNTFT